MATHIRLAPRVPDPAPHYDDVVAEVERFLLERADRALASRDPGRSRHHRRRPRPREDGATVAAAAAAVGKAGLARLSACCCRLRTRRFSGSCSSSASKSAATPRWHRRLSGSPAAAASCESTTSPAPARCATCWRRSLEAVPSPGDSASRPRAEPASDPHAGRRRRHLRGEGHRSGASSIVASSSCSPSSLRPGATRTGRGPVRHVPRTTTWRLVRGHSPSRSRNTGAPSGEEGLAIGPVIDALFNPALPRRPADRRPARRRASQRRPGGRACNAAR